MKYCSKCGAPLNDDDLFCSACGAKQEAAPQVEGEVPPNQEVGTATPAPKKEGVGIRDFTPLSSALFVIGYAVIFAINLILRSTGVLTSENVFPQLGFTIAAGAILAIMIMRMVHAINIKNEFLKVLQICFVALMGVFFISNLILLFTM